MAARRRRAPWLQALALGGMLLPACHPRAPVGDAGPPPAAPAPPSPPPAAAPAGEDPLAAREDLVRELTPEAWQTLSAERGGVRFIKLVVLRHDVADLGDDEVLFFDPQVHPLHIDFLRKNGLVDKDRADAVQRETWQSDERRFIFANLSYYDGEGGGRWVLETFEHDHASPAMVAELFQAVRSRAFMGDALRYKPNSLEQAERAGALPALGVVVVDNQDLRLDLPFVVQNAGRPAVGRLRIVDTADPMEVERALYNRDEIVLLGTIPNDITRVAGIVTLEPTTPLSHVNLRARGWDVPNVMIRDALGLAWREGWEGRWVYLAVGEGGVPVLRLATAEEVEAARARDAARPRYQVPRADLSPGGLPDLAGLRAVDLPRVGAKAANLGELMTLAAGGMDAARARAVAASREPQPGQVSAAFVEATGEVTLDVPAGFVVPFFVYDAFLKMPENAAIPLAIDAALADPSFQGDPIVRRARLAELRALIEAGAFPPGEAEAILLKVKEDLGGRPVYVRSSTNSEDLKGFNGAGLYATVPNVTGGEAVLAAIKVVWASVWRLPAFEAREDFGIDHRAVYPAAIVQLAAAPEAAGVLVTRDVFARETSPRAYLNANPGAGSHVVETGMRPEQIYVDTVTGAVTRVSLSEASPQPVVSDEDARRLALLGALIEAHFTALGDEQAGPQDVEWLVEGGRIRIVQARPWVGGAPRPR